MLTAEICQAYGWTYEQYQSQPEFFITLIKEKIRVDRKSAEFNAKHGR
jgi:hypothetical protein